MRKKKAKKKYYFTEACDFLEKEYDRPQPGDMYTTIEDAKTYQAFKELDFDVRLDEFLYVNDPEADRALIEKDFNEAFEWAWEEIIQPQLERQQEALEEEIHSFLEELEHSWSDAAIKAALKKIIKLKGKDHD